MRFTLGPGSPTLPPDPGLRDEETLLARFVDPERAYAEVILPLKLSMARDYVRGRSFTGDLKLIFQTLARL